MAFAALVTADGWGRGQQAGGYHQRGGSSHGQQWRGGHSSGHGGQRWKRSDATGLEEVDDLVAEASGDPWGHGGWRTRQQLQSWQGHGDRQWGPRYAAAPQQWRQHKPMHLARGSLWGKKKW